MDTEPTDEFVVEWQFPAQPADVARPDGSYVLTLDAPAEDRADTLVRL